jgi:Flp pilus assembly protein TadG
MGGKARAGGRGQSLVEFALVLPMFLLVMLGLIDFGRLLFSYVSLANGAREMSRVVSISASTSTTAPIDAFNNLTLVGGSMNPATDSVVINVYDETGTAQGSVTCTLPLTYAGCTPPTTSGFHDGWVDISATYVFNFNPLFQNRLAGVVDVSLLQPISTLTTTVRSYIE